MQIERKKTTKLKRSGIIFSSDRKPVTVKKKEKQTLGRETGKPPKEKKGRGSRLRKTPKWEGGKEGIFSGVWMP